jgi:hypothetical protein
MGTAFGYPGGQEFISTAKKLTSGLSDDEKPFFF